MAENALVKAATDALADGNGAVIAIGVIVLGIAGAVKLLHIVKSAMGR